MPRRTDGPRRRGASIEWEQLANDDIALWATESEVWAWSPFNSRDEVLASYPQWRTNYLEHCRIRHDAREPQDPGAEAPDYLRGNYQHSYRVWVSQGYAAPRIERWYKGE
jgi:hypothetical protein